MTISSSSPTVYGNDPYIILNNQGDIKGPYLLSQPFHILGRDPDQADLTLPEAWSVVSRRQASLRKVGTDYSIHDNDGVNYSSNRLFIRNSLISPKEGHILVHGDEITIGQNPQTWVIITYYNPHQSQVGSLPKNRIVSLQNRSVLIGRDSEANLVLDSPTVSRRHAIIEPDSDQGYLIKDVSTNGVFVDDQKVTGTAVLKEGSNIRIGPFLLILKNQSLILADQGKNIRLDINDLVKFSGGKLNHISFPIEPGEFVAIVGGSGAGKSTLLKALLGIESTDQGNVYLNGQELRKNFNIYRNQIGYVPQNDIVHKELTVKEVLQYAAKLRLSTDLEIDNLVSNTLEKIEMDPYQDQLVKNLSGGQVKRVSIGVELLANPMIFFLDEPTSGLDPGLDQKMMQLLRRLADQGKTVILVTHATDNINLCDRLLFLGLEGHLCYFGTPQDALNFFQVNSTNFADIYLKLESLEQVKTQSEQYHQSSYYYKYIQNRLITDQEINQKVTPQQIKRSFLEQLFILSQRAGQIAIRDQFNLALSLFTAPLGIILVKLALGDQIAFVGEAAVDLAPLALRVLFVFTCTAIWLGLFSSLPEIVKENQIYLRERLVNLGLIAYLASKNVILASLALVQSILITLVILLGFSLPITVLIPWTLGLIITNFLTILAAQNLGLAVSAFVRNITQANSALPILLLPQIIFSGVLFTIQGIGRYLSWLTISRWSVGAYGTLFNINAMVPATEQLYNLEGLPIEIELPFDGSPVYSYDWRNLSLNWLILLLHSCIYFYITIKIQRRKDII